ncbi:hypothetical protein GEMRC1_003784 [Eukaryota sp. GEM-RC1]
MTPLSKKALRNIHKDQIQQLTNAFQSLAASFPKSDKKSRKSVQKAMDTELAQLKQLQDDQLSQLSCAGEVSDLTPNHNPSLTDPSDFTKKKKRKKRNQDLYNDLYTEAETQIQQAGPSPFQLEYESLSDLLHPLGLEIYKVPADGSCLFASLAHQLTQIDIEVSVTQLRNMMSKYVVDHEAEYAPFIEGDVDTYSKRVLEDDFWGGDLEINMACKLFKCDVEVFQVGGSIKFDCGSPRAPLLRLVLHKKMISSGFHYSSVRVSQ